MLTGEYGENVTNIWIEEPKTTIMETRKLYSGDLRQLCIKKNWYTCGDNQDYEKLLSASNNCDNVTPEFIVQVAMDIIYHSNTDYPLTSVCFEVAEICHSFFEIKEGE